MKKKIFKLLSFLMIMLLSLTSISAQEIVIEIAPTSVSIDDYVSLIAPDGSVNYLQPPYIYNIKVNGKFAFCIEPIIEVGNGLGYTQSDFNSKERELFSRIIYHGFDSQSKTDEDWVLTQIALWKEGLATQIQGKINILNFDEKLDLLVSKVKNHDVKSSFHNQTISLKAHGSITLNDENKVLKDFSIIDDGGLKVEKKNNQLIVTATESSPSTSVIKFRKYADLPSDYAVTPILYSHPISQNVISGGQPDPVLMELKIKIEQPGKLLLSKIDEEQTPIPNVKFNLSVNKDMSQPVGSYKTNQQGVIDITDLYAGIYYLQEIESVKPYILNDEIHEIELKEGQLTTFTHENKKANGYFTLKKSDAETQAFIADAVYQILNEENKVVDHLTTNQLGEAKSKILPLGTYIIKETVAPEGYLLDHTNHKVELTYKDENTPVVSTHLDTVNQPIKGKIKIVKVNKFDEEQPIENAVFEVLQLPERKVVEIIKTDKNGFAITSELRFGDYVLKEIEAPNEFYLNNQEYLVTIENDNEMVVQYIANDQVQIKLGIQKNDSETNEPIAGAIFEIRDSLNEVVSFYYQDDNFEIQQQTQLMTNSQGLAFTRGYLPIGLYTLVEVKAASGYVRAEPIEFEISRDTKTVDLEVIGKTKFEHLSNDKTVIEIKKVNTDFEPLTGAVISIMDKEEIVLTFTSGLEAFVIKGLEVGKRYTLKEEQAPNNYILSDPIEFEVLETKELQTFTLINEKEPQIKTIASFSNHLKMSFPNVKDKVLDMIELKNLWVDQEYVLKGALIDKDTEKVVSISEISFVATTSDMEIEMNFDVDTSKLSGRELVVVEELFRNNRLVGSHRDIHNQKQSVYVLNPTLKTQANTNEREIESSNMVSIVDTIVYTDLIINQEYQVIGTLMDKQTQQPFLVNQQPLIIKQTFTPKSPNGQIEMEFRFDQSSLKKGELVVFEELWLGDQLIASHKDFFDMNQTIKIVEITINKIDAFNQNKKLEGAKFILKQNDTVINHQTTNQKGELVFVVEEGSYQIQEIEAPEGYQLESSQIELIDVFSNVYLDVTNKPYDPLPKTGTDSSFYLLFVSLGLISLGVYLTKKKERN